MSDELPAGLVNVEDDETPPASSSPDRTPALQAGDSGSNPDAGTTTPVATTEGEDLDLNAIDVKDEQRVRGLIGELSRKRAENRTLKEQATKAAQLEAENAQLRPYADFLKNNPQVLQPPRQPDPVPTQPEADPDAVEAARLMDFYTADGKPDVDRGARWLALQDRRSSRAAQQAVQPMQQESVHAKAQANYTQLRTWANSAGVKQQIIDGLWTAAAGEPGGLETLAKPDSLRAIALMAMGANAMATPKQPAAPAQAPVVTEPGGGRATTPAMRLSGLEERTLAQKGLSAAKYEELTKGFKPGVSNVLED